jgi:hypothetical protein
MFLIVSPGRHSSAPLSAGQRCSYLVCWSSWQSSMQFGEISTGADLSTPQDRSELSLPVPGLLVTSALLSTGQRCLYLVCWSSWQSSVQVGDISTGSDLSTPQDRSELSLPVPCLLVTSALLSKGQRCLYLHWSVGHLSTPQDRSEISLPVPGLLVTSALLSTGQRCLYLYLICWSPLHSSVQIRDVSTCTWSAGHLSTPQCRSELPLPVPGQLVTTALLSTGQRCDYLYLVCRSPQHSLVQVRDVSTCTWSAGYLSTPQYRSEMSLPVPGLLVTSALLSTDQSCHYLYLVCWSPEHFSVQIRDVSTWSIICM